MGGNNGRRERFWRTVCQLKGIWVVLLVLNGMLLAGSIIALALVEWRADSAALVISVINTAVLAPLLLSVAYILRRCRTVEV